MYVFEQLNKKGKVFSDTMRRVLSNPRMGAQHQENKTCTTNLS